MKKILLLSIILAFTSCSTSISTKLVNKNYSKLNDGSQVIILEKGEELPSGSELIGGIKIGDSGFTTDCGYNKVIADATNAATNAGANIIQITQIKKPTALGSTCYRLKANIYRNLNAESFEKIKTARNLKNKSRLPEDSDYAIIYFYRPIYQGFLVSYSIKDANNKVIGKMNVGTKFAYKTKNFGEQVFHATTETKEEVKINVQRGQEYFVRCAVSMGVVIGRPDINLTENHIGIKEYGEVKIDNSSSNN